MKILFVSDYYPSVKRPQFCIFIQQQAQALIKLGHEVEVIVPTNVNHLKEKQNPSKLEGVTVHYAEYFTLYKRIYNYLAFIRNIRCYEKWFDFKSYDIISLHMFDEFTLRIFTRIAKRHRKKLILHYHGLSLLYDKPQRFLVRILQRRGDYFLKRLVSKADAFVGVSDKVCHRLSQQYSNITNFTVYNGVNTELFYPDRKNNLNEFRIIAIASLKKIKGNHYLIEAVRMLCNENPDEDIKLFIIGYGPEAERLKALTKELNLEDKVHFIGYLKYEAVAAILRDCDVYAMPSYYEALGCAYLEAMACKLPVIGCYDQGIDEIIINGVNGFLVKPHQVKELYEKLNYLLKNPDKRKEMAQKGYETVTNGFTWRDSAIALLRVYQRVIASER